MNMIRIALLTVIATAAISGQAAEPGDPVEKKVSYAELDLSKPQAVEALYRRLKTAAEFVCQAQFAKEQGASRILWKKCVNGAMTRAVADVDAPRLNAYFAAKTGKPAKPVAVAAGR